MTSRAARFSAVYAALTAAHEVADYWVQRDTDALTKGQPGRDGRAACGRHVTTYTATQALALAATSGTLGLRLSPHRAALALAISATTHYAADRSAGHWRDEQPTTLLPRLANRLGKTGWITHDPTAGPLLDQSWHKGWIAVAALAAAR